MLQRQFMNIHGPVSPDCCKCFERKIKKKLLANSCDESIYIEDDISLR